jgi:hypothetical protein
MKEPPLSDQIKYTFWAIIMSFVIVSFSRLIANEDPKLNKREASNFMIVLFILIINVVVLKSN